MTRDCACDALILSAKEGSSGHLFVTLLTQNAGVKHATLFGGRKSRLRALVSPWHTGKIWLYEQNPQSIKITDFDAQKYRHTFRESLSKTQAASLASELVITTKGAGGVNACWTLVNGFLDGLDKSVDSDVPPALLRFLWRFLDLLGIQPSLESCARCGDALENAVQCMIQFNGNENGFLCADCTAEMRVENLSAGNFFELPQEAFEYLNAVSLLDAKQSRRLPLCVDAADALKQVLFYLINAASGERLKTLDIALL